VPASARITRPCLRQAPPNEPETKVRSKRSTMTGADTITSLVPMPRRHEANAANHHTPGAPDSVPRTKQ
jgi:hypothetical protein